MIIYDHRREHDVRLWKIEESSMISHSH